MGAHGRTPGCPGCRALPGRLGAHAEACREQVTKAWTKAAKERLVELERQFGASEASEASGLEMEADGLDEAEAKAAGEEADETFLPGATTPLGAAHKEAREARRPPTRRK